MTLNVLSNILKKHKYIFSFSTVLFAAGIIIYAFAAYARLMAVALLLCSFGCVFYAVADELKHCGNRLTAYCSGLYKLIFRVIIILFLLSFAFIELLIISNEKDEDLYSKYVIVLGCAVYGTEPSPVLECRLDRAARYLEKYPDSTAVLCGGKGANESVCESEVMYNYLVQAGIDSSRLITEKNSYDTRQNIKEAKKIIDANESSNVIDAAVITNGFHLYRAELIMEKQGFENITTLKAQTPRNLLLILNLYLREYFSVILEYFNI